MSATTWRTLRPEDRTIIWKVAKETMVLQKREAREGLQHDMTALDTLRRVYGMEAVLLSPKNLAGVP